MLQEYILSPYESCTGGRDKGRSPSGAWAGGWQQWLKPSGGQTANGEPRAEVSQATNWKPGSDVDWISNRTTKAGAGGADDGERKDPGAGDASTNPGDLSTEPQPGGASANSGPQEASADPGTDELFLKNETCGNHLRISLEASRQAGRFRNWS